MNELSFSKYPRLPLPTMTGPFGIWKLLYLTHKPSSFTILCKRSHPPWYPLISSAVHCLHLPLSLTQMESLNITLRWFTSASLMIGSCFWKWQATHFFSPNWRKIALSFVWNMTYCISVTVLPSPHFQKRLFSKTETYTLGKSHTMGELFHSMLSGIEIQSFLHASICGQKVRQLPLETVMLTSTST